MFISAASDDALRLVACRLFKSSQRRKRAVRSAALQAAPGLDPTRVEVTVDRTGGLGQPVEVIVGYEATIAVPLAGVIFPSEVSLEASTAMRQEFP